MKKSMRLFITVILVIALTLSMTACVNNQVTPTPSPTVSPTVAPTVEPTVEPTKKPDGGGSTLPWPDGPSSRPVVKLTFAEAVALTEWDNSKDYSISSRSEGDLPTVTVGNELYTGTVTFDRIDATGKSLELKFPKADIVVEGQVKANTLSVSAKENTTTFKGEVILAENEKVIIASGGFKVETPTMPAITIPNTNTTIKEINVDGALEITIEERESSITIYINETGDLKLTNNDEETKIVAKDDSTVNLDGNKNPDFINPDGSTDDSAVVVGDPTYFAIKATSTHDGEEDNLYTVIVNELGVEDVDGKTILLFADYVQGDIENPGQLPNSEGIEFIRMQFDAEVTIIDGATYTDADCSEIANYEIWSIDKYGINGEVENKDKSTYNIFHGTKAGNNYSKYPNADAEFYVKYKIAGEEFFRSQKITIDKNFFIVESAEEMKTALANANYQDVVMPNVAISTDTVTIPENVGLLISVPFTISDEFIVDGAIALITVDGPEITNPMDLLNGTGTMKFSSTSIFNVITFGNGEEEYLTFIGNDPTDIPGFLIDENTEIEITKNKGAYNFKFVSGAVTVNDMRFANYIGENDVWTVNKGVTLTISTSLANHGKIVNNGTIINNGAITSSGTIENNGTINNNVTIDSTGTITNKGKIHNIGTITGDITNVDGGTSGDYIDGSTNFNAQLDYLYENVVGEYEVLDGDYFLGVDSPRKKTPESIEESILTKEQFYFKVGTVTSKASANGITIGNTKYKPNGTRNGEIIPTAIGNYVEMNVSPYMIMKVNGDLWISLPVLAAELAQVGSGYITIATDDQTFNLKLAETVSDNELKLSTAVAVEDVAEITCNEAMTEFEFISYTTHSNPDVMINVMDGDNVIDITAKGVSKLTVEDFFYIELIKPTQEFTHSLKTFAWNTTQIPIGSRSCFNRVVYYKDYGHVSFKTDFKVVESPNTMAFKEMASTMTDLTVDGSKIIDLTYGEIYVDEEWNEVCETVRTFNATILETAKDDAITSIGGTDLFVKLNDFGVAKIQIGTNPAFDFAPTEVVKAQFMTETAQLLGFTNADTTLASFIGKTLPITIILNTPNQGFNQDEEHIRFNFVFA